MEMLTLHSESLRLFKHKIGTPNTVPQCGESEEKLTYLPMQKFVFRPKFQKFKGGIIFSLLCLYFPYYSISQLQRSIFPSS